MSPSQSKEQFKARVREWAQALDVEIRGISLRAMKRKWASYTRRAGLVIFDLELLAMDPALADYVIVHELLHVKVPNHGKLWKSMMRVHLGDYERLEAELRAHVSRPAAEPESTPPAVQGGGQGG